MEKIEDRIQKRIKDEVINMDKLLNIEPIILIRARNKEWYNILKSTKK